MMIEKFLREDGKGKEVMEKINRARREKKERIEEREGGEERENGGYEPDMEQVEKGKKEQELGNICNII